MKFDQLYDKVAKYYVDRIQQIAAPVLVIYSEQARQMIAPKVLIRPRTNHADGEMQMNEQETHHSFEVWTFDGIKSFKLGIYLDWASVCRDDVRFGSDWDGDISVNLSIDCDDQMDVASIVGELLLVDAWVLLQQGSEGSHFRLVLFWRSCELKTSVLVKTKH